MKKKIRFLLSEIFHCLVVKFSVYLNRHVFVMLSEILLMSSQLIIETELFLSFKPVREGI